MRILIFTILNTTTHPPSDRLLHASIESTLGRLHVDDVILYYVKTHRSHPGIKYNKPEVVRLHLVHREGRIEVLHEAKLCDHLPVVDEVMRFVRIADIASVLSYAVLRLGEHSDALRRDCFIG